MNTIFIDGLSFALPLFIMAIGGIYSERSGITNLALEGLQGVGAFVGVLSAVFMMQWLGTSSQIPILRSAALCNAGRYGFMQCFMHCFVLSSKPIR